MEKKTIKKDSWHYKLIAKSLISVRGDIMPQTSCEYITCLVIAILGRFVVYVIIPVFVLFIVSVVVFAFVEKPMHTLEFFAVCAIIMAIYSVVYFGAPRIIDYLIQTFKKVLGPLKQKTCKPIEYEE